MGSRGSGWAGDGGPYLFSGQSFGVVLRVSGYRLVGGFVNQSLRVSTAGGASKAVRLDRAVHRFVSQLHGGDAPGRTGDVPVPLFGTTGVCVNQFGAGIHIRFSHAAAAKQIGRASCRARVEISGRE